MAISATIFRRSLASRSIYPLSASSRFLSPRLDSTMSTLSQTRFALSRAGSRSILTPSPSLPTSHHTMSRKLSTGRFRNDERLSWGARLLVYQEEACVIERFGKFSRILEAGMHFLLPVVDRIAYVVSLKEHPLMIPQQLAVTSDHIHVKVNAVLFVKVIDAKKASYGIDNLIYAVTELAQAVIRSDIGQMPLDSLFMERAKLNAKIVESINCTALKWGLVCCGCNIKDVITGTKDVIKEQMAEEAHRKKQLELVREEQSIPQN